MTSSSDPVGVLAVDDQPIFLDAAREVVTATPGFEWLAGATCGQDALDAVGEMRPMLVLLDVRMPGMDGIETARRISESHPDVIVVLVSVDESCALDPAVAASGAVALVRKQEFGPAMLRRLWRSYRRPRS